MKKTVVKEGPLVLIWRLIYAEISMTLLFYGVSYLANYEEFYRSIGILKLIRYDIFLIITFSLIQILIILTLFIYWYFAYFEITDSEVAKVKGIINRNRKTYLLDHLRSIDIDQGIFERKMSHATITLHFEGNKDVKMRNVGRFEEANEALSISLSSKKKLQSLDEILELGEGAEVEFKETLRFDVKKNSVSKDIEKAVLKTIAGFLNSKGGCLLIGVDDVGYIEGLSRDLSTLKKPNKDGFQNYLMTLFKETFGSKTLGRIIVRFETKNEKDICLVNVLNGSEPVFIKNEGKEDFYVRNGNGTHPLSMSEAQAYIKQRFG